MLIALWILNVVLALVFLAAGGVKLAKSKEALAASGMTWTINTPAWQVKAVGAMEVAGAIGLIAPLATGIAPILTPVAAVGIAVVMIGASISHIRLKEKPKTLALVAAAVASAAIGFVVIG